MPGVNGLAYVTPAQLLNYLPAATLNLATDAQQLQACADATSEADGYLSNRYAMPLQDWGPELTKYTAYIAVYQLMFGPIGLAPQAGSDANITRNYFQAVGGQLSDGTRLDGWFPRIQRQALVPDITPSVPTGSDPGHDAPQVCSQPPRGWQQFRNGRSVIGGF
jgi:phage gp36-like protein